jgi:Cu(I)/Ag(I) efflux system membrane fusion protein
VLDGLAEGDRIVTSGQFMLDSESQLRDAIQKMLKAPETDAGAKAPAVSGGETKVPEPPTPGNAAAKPAHANDAATVAVGMDEMSMLPADALVLLKNLAVATMAGGEALSADDLAGYQNRLPGMRQALATFLAGSKQAEQGPLGKFKAALPDRDSLKAFRRDFAYFSTAVADLVRENHLQPTESFHIFQCPMAPGIGTGRWLQRSGAIKNPFYGAAMPDCGDEIK